MDSQRGNLVRLIPEPEAGDEVLKVQRKLCRWSEQGTYQLSKLFNLLYNPCVLSMAWHRLSRNRGSSTPGIDKVTAKAVREDIGVESWLTGIAERLRQGDFQPAPSRRVHIPKASDPTKTRPLGIPTLEDRLVQMALKLILEPIFEAHFKWQSFGFRPNRGPLFALAAIRAYTQPNIGTTYVVEADFRSCFERIPHGQIIQQVARRVKDRKILTLIKSFLKAGVMERGQLWDTVAGTPQGGVISPLLANIFLHQLDEHYDELYEEYMAVDRTRRHLWRRERPVLRYIRYADDFVILVNGSEEQASQVLADLETFVEKKLHMELAPEKTGVRPLTDGFEFLGYRIRQGHSQHSHHRPMPVMLPSPEAEKRFRLKVKEATGRSTLWMDPDDLIRSVNRVVRGWGEYFSYGCCTRLFHKLDWHVRRRVSRWLRNKHSSNRRSRKKSNRKGPTPGTWKFVSRVYYHRDITGRRRWRGKKVWLDELHLVFPSHRRKLPYTFKSVRSPFDPQVGEQRHLWHYSGETILSTMERSLRRRKAVRWKARCGETRTPGLESSRGETSA